MDKDKEYNEFKRKLAFEILNSEEYERDYGDEEDEDDE